MAMARNLPKMGQTGAFSKALLRDDVMRMPDPPSGHERRDDEMARHGEFMRLASRAAERIGMSLHGTGEDREDGEARAILAISASANYRSQAFERRRRECVIEEVRSPRRSAEQGLSI